jgi:hypothetical protein
MLLAPGLTGAWLFKHWKNQISNLEKNSKNISRCSQLYALGSCNFAILNTLLWRLRKKDKLVKFWKEKKSDTVHTARSVILLFLLRTDYKVFQIITGYMEPVRWNDAHSRSPVYKSANPISHSRTRLGTGPYTIYAKDSTSISLNHERTWYADLGCETRPTKLDCIRSPKP